MHCSKPFPGQADQMFKDKFCKWPKLMRALVIISLFPPAAALFMVTRQLAPIDALDDTLSLTIGFNVILLLWGILLKIRSRKYWYRNYHIGKTMALAVMPLIASGYILLQQPEVPSMAKQQKNQTVYISLN